MEDGLAMISKSNDWREMYLDSFCLEQSVAIKRKGIWPRGRRVGFNDESSEHHNTAIKLEE